jgi:adenosylmethionine-8-amino-7-oxononanoate aminotransferase
MDEGLLCYPGGFWMNQEFVPHILLAPPMIVEEKDLLSCAEIMVRVIDRVFRGA